jgi:flagellar hook-associated protein 2
MSSLINVSDLLGSSTNWSTVVATIEAANLTAATSSYKTTKDNLNTLLSAWQSFNSVLSAVTDYIDTKSMNGTGAYNGYSTSLTSSDSSVTASNVLTATASSSAAAGTYRITVSSVAAAEKIATDAFESSSSELGVSGEITINGTTISISSTDTLNNVASAINSGERRVTATVLSTSGGYILEIQSKSTGASGI